MFFRLFECIISNMSEHSISVICTVAIFTCYELDYFFNYFFEFFQYL